MRKNQGLTSLVSQNNPKNLATKKRLEEIKNLIKTHRDNFQLVIDFALGTKKFKRKCLSLRVQNDQRTEEEDQSLLWTLTNLRTQIRALQQELNTLSGDKQV